MTTLQKLRNIGISAHIDSGKTTLTERMLYYCGRIHRMREVRGDDGGATMDFRDLEKRHGITISSAVTRVDWDDYQINVIDTPGHVDFTIEVERSLRVLDGAVLVLCAVGGVQSQSVTVDRQMKRYGVPRIAFINKMDRSGADPERVIGELRDRLHCNPVAVQIPIGAGAAFDGVVDLITMEAVFFRGSRGELVERSAIPAEFVEPARLARERLLDELSGLDDDLTECLMQDIDVTADQLRQVLRRNTIEHRVTPVLLGSAYRNQGVQEVLDAVNRYLPSPADRKVEARVLVSDADSNEPQRVELSSDRDDPLVAMAFKTVVESFGQLTFMRLYQGTVRRGQSLRNARTGQQVRFGRLLRIHAGQREDIDQAQAGDIIGVIGVDCASGDTFLGDGVRVALENIHVPDPVIRMAIAPRQRDDADRLARALARFRREDPTFQVTTDPQTGETLIAGMGQLHLDLYVERLLEESECECVVGVPRVAYKQRPTRSVEFSHVLKKRTGGPGQFAHVVGIMDPLSEDIDSAFVFENEVTGGRIPREFIPAVKKGFEDELFRGPLGEFEVVGVRILLQDGDFHEVDSTEMAFRQCAREAMRSEILPAAAMTLLEPVMKLDVEIPAEFQGAVTGHLVQRRGTVTGSERGATVCDLTAEVPLAEIFDYASVLRSMTRGQGTFTMEFLCYRDTPNSVQAQVLKSSRS